MLKRRCGNTGGKHKADIQLGLLGSVKHKTHTVHSADIHDLVRICDYGSRAVGNQKPSDFLRCDIRRFNVNVTVYEAGNSILPFRIDFLYTLIITDSGNTAVGNRNGLILQNRSVIYVHDIAVFDHQISRYSACRYIYSFS
ncbi:hypothetical protein SDC9_209835 [bioreactor metagenome]|uniref:Uncharacterized protein n=1 Tax=bioreactor metagenome TaxID=1076179 RepID=A0A645JHC1_9ZZZZ